MPIKPGVLRVIAHGCNAQGVMGSGFAKQLRARYPGAYQEYVRHAVANGLRVGEVVPWASRGEMVLVANMITQEFYGRDSNFRYVSYNAVHGCLVQTLHMAKMTTLPFEIHMPFVGGGLANGDRSVLMSIFKDVLGEENTTLWVDKAMEEA